MACLSRENLHLTLSAGPLYGTDDSRIPPWRGDARVLSPRVRLGVADHARSERDDRALDEYKTAITLADLAGLLYVVYFSGYGRNWIVRFATEWAEKPELCRTVPPCNDRSARPPCGR
jgi:hypothetical protein